MDGFNWDCEGTVPGDAIAGVPLTILVNANAVYLPPDRPPGEEIGIRGTGTVHVILKVAPPTMTVALSDPTEVITEPSQPYSLTFNGTAQADSGIASVQFHLGNNDFAPVDNNSSGNWATWSKTIDLPAGEYLLTIEARAKDRHQLPVSRKFHILVKTSFDAPVDQVFAPTTYLRELLDFAKRQIKIGATATGPTALDLATRFFQPFDKLTLSDVFEQAVRPVHQARIAVEVLRRYIPHLEPHLDTSEIDRRFRFAAYQVIVRELGTSSEELRLARVADPATRKETWQALAARIGIELKGPQQKDRLKRITLSPNAVTDENLEELFGYRSTAVTDDPLEPPGPAPLVLT
jgi:hypothetical protein